MTVDRRGRTAPTRPAATSDEDGFTLIELLVVIIIIGILAAIAIPVFLNQRRVAYQASEKSDLRTTANEMESYFQVAETYGTAPFGSGTGAGSSIAGPTVTVGTDQMTMSPFNTITLVAAGANGYCLKAVSTRPGTNAYFYDSLGGGTSRTVCSASSHSY